MWEFEQSGVLEYSELELCAVWDGGWGEFCHWDDGDEWGGRGETDGCWVCGGVGGWGWVGDCGADGLRGVMRGCA